MNTLESLSKENRKFILDGIETISIAFWGPDLTTCEEISKPEYTKPFQSLRKLIDGMEEPLSALKSTIASLIDSEALFQRLETCYVGLFINNRKGDIVPLYASCYAGDAVDGQRPMLMGRDAVEMRQRISKMGLELMGPSNEPPDHISIELEYLYYLLSKGWAEKDNPLLSEAGTFANDAMLPWVAQWKDRLIDSAECRFYPLLATMTELILAFIAGTRA